MFTQVDIMTALITPFTDDNQIDYRSLDNLTNYLLDHGTKGFVIGGTTGEIATLTVEEKLTLYRRFSEIVAKRVPIIAGTGSNNTKDTIELTQAVSKIAGIDAALVVVPYYNKPDQNGMWLHFKAVAESSILPIVIYNIPGRTVVQMTPQTVLKLAQEPNIIGIKQCGDLIDLQAIIQSAPADFTIYSGEDEQALTAKILGAQGIISVASHCYGPQINAMYQALNQGDWQLAAKWQRLLTPRMKALFMYPSPSAVKAILNAQGFSVGGCRLPIATLNTTQEKLLAQNLQVADLGQDLAFNIGG